MIKHVFSVSAAVIFILAGFLFLDNRSSLAAAAPCELYTRADAESLFNEPVSEGISRRTSVPDGESCRYSFKKNGGSYGLTIKVSESAAIKEQGIFESAADIMGRQKKARKASEHATTTFQELPGLGDDAFWSGSDLWVRKGEILLVITVHSVLEGSFQNREAMDAAGNEQDLALSRKVAEAVLSRLA